MTCDGAFLQVESYFTVLSVADCIMLNDSWIGEDLELVMA